MAVSKGMDGGGGAGGPLVRRPKFMSASPPFPSLPSPSVPRPTNCFGEFANDFEGESSSAENLHRRPTDPEKQAGKKRPFRHGYRETTMHRTNH